MRIRFYGPLAEAIGRQIDLDVRSGCSIAEVREQLRCGWPGAASQLHRSRAILGNLAVAEDHQLNVTDQLEFLPPVSGG